MNITELEVEMISVIQKNLNVIKIKFQEIVKILIVTEI